VAWPKSILPLPCAYETLNPKPAKITRYNK
jgi:hypothetical protein